jgi:hypothetical protein
MIQMLTSSLNHCVKIDYLDHVVSLAFGRHGFLESIQIEYQGKNVTHEFYEDSDGTLYKYHGSDLAEIMRKIDAWTDRLAFFKKTLEG